MWNLKNNTKMHMQNRFTDIENKLVVTKWEKEEERDKLGVWDQQTMCETDKQQGYTVQHRKFYLLSYNNL